MVTHFIMTTPRTQGWKKILKIMLEEWDIHDWIIGMETGKKDTSTRRSEVALAVTSIRSLSGTLETELIATSKNQIQDLMRAIMNAKKDIIGVVSTPWRLEKSDLELQLIGRQTYSEGWTIRVIAKSTYG